jgi:hypothetical protein
MAYFAVGVIFGLKSEHSKVWIGLALGSCFFLAGEVLVYLGVSGDTIAAAITVSSLIIVIGYLPFFYGLMKQIDLATPSSRSIKRELVFITFLTSVFSLVYFISIQIFTQQNIFELTIVFLVTPILDILTVILFGRVSSYMRGGRLAIPWSTMFIGSIVYLIADVMLQYSEWFSYLSEYMLADLVYIVAYGIIIVAVVLCISLFREKSPEI